MKTLNFTRKSKFNALYKKSVEQYWLPESINLSTDKLQWPSLSSELKSAVLSLLKYAIVLDSYQVTNVSDFCTRVSDPDLKALLSIHAFMESVHSASYSYFAETVCSATERKDLYKLDAGGEERLSTLYKITDCYGKVSANYWLEAVAFQGLFRLSDILRSQDVLPGLSSLIQLINRDEELHIKTFAELMTPEDKEITRAALMEFAPVEGLMISELTEIKEFAQYYPFVAAHYLKALGFGKDPEISRLVKVGSPFNNIWHLGDSSKKKLKGNFFTSSLVYDNARPDLDWNVDHWFTT